MLLLCVVALGFTVALALRVGLVYPGASLLGVVGLQQPQSVSSVLAVQCSHLLIKVLVDLLFAHTLSAVAGWRRHVVWVGDQLARRVPEETPHEVCQVAVAVPVEVAQVWLVPPGESALISDDNVLFREIIGHDLRKACEVVGQRVPLAAMLAGILRA